MLPFLMAIIATVAAGSALGADLDAPVSQTPTIGSEIYRGANAELDCSLKLNLNVIGYRRCISDADSRNQQTHQGDTKPFQLGLYFHAWTSDDIAVETTAGRLENALWRSAAQADYVLFQRIQLDLGISDDQLIQATKMRPAALMPRLARWKEAGGRLPH